jgi:AGCS family alanine or glycine:cation symporter
METLYKIFGWVNNNILWGIPMIVLILVAGILLTARSKFFQVRKFKTSLKSTMGESFIQMCSKNKKTTKVPTCINQ